mmetsp:Transcript_37502/g.87273  ORF Transcript_37502/g.87273 Transcript_37502/m.87273 type:complete len:340 (+) Transcript_37502:841-1860(+)
MVAVVGRHDDGGGRAGVAAGQARDLPRPVPQERGACQRRGHRPAQGHRGAAVDLLRRHSAGGAAGLLCHPSVLRRARVDGPGVAAADLRAQCHLHQFDGADLLDPHRRAVQDHPVHDGRVGPQQPGIQPAARRHDGRDRQQRGQPAQRHQARLHARRQAAPAGHWPCHRQPGWRAGLLAAVHAAVPEARRQRRAQHRVDGVRPVRLPERAAVEGCGRHHRARCQQPADLRRRVDGRRRTGGHRDGSRAHPYQGPLRPFGCGHRPRRRAAARGRVRHVCRRAVVPLHGRPAQAGWHPRPSGLGAGHGADLRGPDLGRGADGYRQRDHQRRALIMPACICP